MKKEEVVEYIKKHRWYRQACGANPYSSSAPVTAFSNNLGKFKLVLNYYNNFHDGCFDLDREIEVSKEMVEKAMKSKKFIDKLIKDWKEIEKKVDKMFDYVISNGVEGMDEKEFIAFQAKYSELFYDLWVICVFVEPFYPCGEQLLDEEIGKSGLKMSKEDVKVLVSPENLFVHEEIELKLIELVDLDDVSPQIKELQEQYFWKNNDWANSYVVGEDYFYEELEKLRSKGGLSRLKKEISGKIDLLLKQKKKIIKRYNVPIELQNLFYFFSEMTYFREIRKINTQKTTYCYDQFMDYVNKRTGIEKKYLCYMVYNELKDLKFTDEYVDILKKRFKSMMCVSLGGGKMKYFIGDGSKEIIEALDEKFREQEEIKGNVACKGKVEGVVKVINTHDDFDKFKKGDILVAPMTRPEYVPLMRKAAAIVTDEGGISCHAAVVSRELGVPCIIGTQVATKILKDGDKVEVDADNGRVRKI